MNTNISSGGNLLLLLLQQQQQQLLLLLLLLLPVPVPLLLTVAEYWRQWWRLQQRCATDRRRLWPPADQLLTGLAGHCNWPRTGGRLGGRRCWLDGKHQFVQVTARYHWNWASYLQHQCSHVVSVSTWLSRDKLTSRLCLVWDKMLKSRSQLGLGTVRLRSWPSRTSAPSLFVGLGLFRLVETFCAGARGCTVHSLSSATCHNSAWPSLCG